MRQYRAVLSDKPPKPGWQISLWTFLEGTGSTYSKERIYGPGSRCADTSLDRRVLSAADEMHSGRSKARDEKLLRLRGLDRYLDSALMYVRYDVGRIAVPARSSRPHLRRLVPHSRTEALESFG
jgi:hypothetical protein